MVRLVHKRQQSNNNTNTGTYYVLRVCIYYPTSRSYHLLFEGRIIIGKVRLKEA